MFKLVLTAEGTITLTEGEMKALDALVGYGDDAFIKHFYEKMGEHYLKPNERDLRGLFKKIRETCGPALDQIEQMRKDLLKASDDRLKAAILKRQEEK